MCAKTAVEFQQHYSVFWPHVMCDRFCEFDDRTYYKELRTGAFDCVTFTNRFTSVNGKTISNNQKLDKTSSIKNNANCIDNGGKINLLNSQHRNNLNYLINSYTWSDDEEKQKKKLPSSSTLHKNTNQSTDINFKSSRISSYSLRATPTTDPQKKKLSSKQSKLVIGQMQKNDKIKNIEANLQMKSLWKEFNELGTEMIVTKPGR